MATTIEWTRGDDGSMGETWNPMRGCQIVSPGCTNCYAMKQAHRFSGLGQPYEELTKMSKSGQILWTGKVRLVPEALDAPLHWRKPRRVFVNSMSDLFHKDVPDEFIDQCFAVMALAPQHTFQVLTKRPSRMLEWFNPKRPEVVIDAMNDYGVNAAVRWPLPNTWLGVSVEDQATADERIPLLLQTPAAVRFISAEPLLSRISLLDFLYKNLQATPEWRTHKGSRQMKLTHEGLRGDLHWVIVGGESGHKARPCHVDWIRSIVGQCKAADVACFVKQVGSNPRGDRPCVELCSRKGGDPQEWPEDIRIRQFPGTSSC